MANWPNNLPIQTREECSALRARVTELESALAKSASREAALVEKLKVAEDALDSIEGGGGVQGEKATAALAKIKEAS